MGEKDWMTLPKYSQEYADGVNEFLDKAFSMSARSNTICCPCKRCCFRYWYPRKIILDHLVKDGFTPGYMNWYFHGEEIQPGMNFKDDINTNASLDGDNVDKLLHDTFRYVIQDFGNTPPEVGYNSNKEAKKYAKLVEEGRQELYPGCKRFSKLSFTIRLYHLKCVHGISNAAFTDLLELIKEAFPEAKIPHSCNEAKKVVKDLGMTYEKIYCCPNDCILY